MQVFVLFGLVIVAMGSLGEQFIGIDQSGLSGEYIGASGANMLGDLAAVGGGTAAIAAWRSQIANRNAEIAGRVSDRQEARTAYEAVNPESPVAEQEWTHWSTKALDANAALEKAEAVPEPVLRVSPILIALALVEGLEQLAGWGPPSEGDDLTAASGQFAELGAVFGSAIAGEDWQGAASRGYTGRTADLQGVAQTIADLDAKLAGIVKAQADAVTHVRLGFGVLKSLLMLAYFYELQTKLAPGGPAYASLAAKVGLTVAGAMIFFLFVGSDGNASKADRVADEYRKLGAATAGAASRRHRPQ